MEKTVAIVVQELPGGLEPFYQYCRDAQIGAAPAELTIKPIIETDDGALYATAGTDLVGIAVDGAVGTLKSLLKGWFEHLLEKQATYLVSIERHSDGKVVKKIEGQNMTLQEAKALWELKGAEFLGDVSDNTVVSTIKD